MVEIVHTERHYYAIAGVAAVVPERTVVKHPCVSVGVAGAAADIVQDPVSDCRPVGNS